MTEKILPTTLSETSREKIKQLAETVFNKKIDQLTKDNIIMLIQMDMSTFASTLTVGASSVRPTNIKFSTNNYHASIEIDISGMFKIVREKLESVEQEKLIDTYLELKTVLFTMITVKYESTEHFLRTLLDKAMKRDDSPTPGRFEETN